MDVMRWIQLGLSVLGLMLSTTCHSVQVVLVTVYVVTIVYLLIIVILYLSNRMGIRHTVQAITELVLGLIMLIYTIYFCTFAGKDIAGIILCVVGFILPACLFITAYDKF